MRKLRIGFMCFLATLLVAFVAGCGQETITLPSVVSVTPAQGATGVAINTTVTATFSQAMSSASISTATFILAGPGGAVTGAVTYSGLVATFTPGAALAYGTTYTATITTGAATPGGAELIGPYAWSFTTGAASVPAVLSVTPLPFAANVPVTGAGATISATFTQAMTAASIAATGTFTVEAQGGVVVPGSAVLNSAGTVATFTPTSGTLANSTTYTVTITTAARSLSQGIPLAGNYVWTFTTAATPLPPAPTVTLTNPANTASGVPLNQVVIASFSEPMDPNTIIGANFTLTVQGSGTPMLGSVSYVGPGNKLMFQLSPSVFLQPSTTYTATISNLVTNVTGTALNGGVVPTVCATSTLGNCVWNFTTTPAGTNNTQPMLVKTFPADGAQGVCQNPAVSATFSEAMNNQTFTSKTFYITDSTGTLVAGTYSYDATNFIETFTPTSPLTPGTFTARVTDGATDMFGIGLLVNATGPPPNPWTFTTNTSTCKPPINLGVLAPFGGMAGAGGMTNMGTETVVNGEIGTTAAATLITGFHDTYVLPVISAAGSTTGCTYSETLSNIGLVTTGTTPPGIAIFTAPGPPTITCTNEGTGTATTGTFGIATAALAQALATYNSLQSSNNPAVGTTPAAPQGTTLVPTELGGTTLYPGVYWSASTVKITSGDLTLDAQGDPNAQFIFQVGSALTVGGTAPRNVFLAHGAQAKNVFWLCATAATINGAGGGIFNGTVIANATISTGTSGITTVTVINGRLISMGLSSPSASTTLVNTVINVPTQ